MVKAGSLPTELRKGHVMIRIVYCMNDPPHFISPLPYLAMSQTSTQDSVRVAKQYLDTRLKALDSSSDTASDSAGRVPLIDLGPSFNGSDDSKRAVATQIDSACRSVGFFQISHHGISAKACQDILTQARRFFHDLPWSKKQTLHIHNSTLFRGWEPNDYTAANPDDWKTDNPNTKGTDEDAVETKEAFNWGYEDQLDPMGGDGNYVELDGERPGPGHGNVWPSEIDLPGFYDAVRDYYGQVLQLARHLFQLFALGLNLPADYFDRLMTHPGGIARLLYYPAQAVDQPALNASHKSLGLGAHTDYECFTLLLASENPGLEILAPSLDNSGSSQWVSVPVRPDCLTVNVADFLMRWTNGVYRSTVHRVINQDPTKERYSVPFFFSINYDEKVETLPSCADEESKEKFPPICAGEYVLERLRATLKEEGVTV